jgi:hypothetical protein
MYFFLSLSVFLSLSLSPFFIYISCPHFFLFCLSLCSFCFCLSCLSIHFKCPFSLLTLLFFLCLLFLSLHCSCLSLFNIFLSFMISVVCPAQLLIHDQQIKILLKIVVVFKSRLDVEKTSLVFLVVCFCFEISNKKTNLFITSLKKC